MKITMTAAMMLTLIVVTATIGVQEKRHFKVFFYRLLAAQFKPDKTLQDE